jgi:hypothetical protein
MSGREQMQQDMDRQTYSITSSAMLSSVGGTTRPSGLVIDGELEFARLHHRQVGRPSYFPAQN